MKRTEQITKKLKNEKGSVTLFVLTTMLFFLIIILLCFAGIRSKLLNQEKQIQIIQEEYRSSGIAQKYDETISQLDLSVYIMLYKESGGVYSVDEWTNENLKLKIIFKDDVEEKYFYKDGVKIPYAENYLITENCTIKAEYGDLTKYVQITKIDKDAPNVQIFPNGGIYKTETGTATIGTQVKAADGLSGIDEIKYAWSTSNEVTPADSEYQTILNGGIISKEQPIGTYYLWVKVKDVAGNVTTLISEPYVIREPLPPTVTMKLNDENGEIYTGTGEWTNQNVYTELSLPASEGNVEKYQYSYDNEKWFDITNEEVSQVNYDMTFPLTADNKPEWMGELTNNGDYYFELDGTSLKSNNGGVASSHANSYIPIDLRNYEGKNIIISINCTISSESNYDYGYAAITQTTDTPARSKDGKIMYVAGTTTTNTYEVEISGGELYYLHFGYTKDSSSNKYNDCFIINSISIKYSNNIRLVESYETAFPLITENKPEWVGELTNNGNYYFEVEGNTLKSNNKGINSSHANSYIPIDLRNYSSDYKMYITVDAKVSSEGNYDYGYAAITESTSTPSRSSSGKIMYISGTTEGTYENKTEITGGKLYYLHFGYTKDGSGNKENDCFIVNKLSIKLETIKEGLVFENYTKNNNIVEYQLQNNMKNKVCFRALYNDSTYSKVSQMYNIKIDNIAPEASYDYEFSSKEKATLTISNITDNLSGVRGYYLSTEETIPTIDNEWIEITEQTINIENLNADENYYLWIIDNAGNISNAYNVEIESPNYLVDNTIYTKNLDTAINKASDNSEIKLLNDYTDESVVTINKNITLNVQKYTLTRTATITVNSSKTVEVVGNGTITSNSSNYIITNNGTLNINMEGKIENSVYAVIRNNSSSAIINVNRGKIISNYQSNSGYAIYNYYGTTNVNEGTIQGYYGIYNDNSSNKNNINGGTIIGTGAYGIYGYGTVTVNEGIIEGKTRGIYQRSGTLNVNGGEIKGDYGVYQYSSSIVNILGGRIEGITYGIYGDNSEEVTIGSSEEELNTTNPSIYGGTYGLYMRDSDYSFNLYNGVLMSDTEKTTYSGILNTRENYIPYTYYDYDVERKWCTVIIPEVSEIVISQEPTDFTNKDVKIKVQYPSTEGLVNQFSEDGENWITVDSVVYEKYISENKKVYARALDISGVLIEKKEYEVNNIDKINPVVSISPEKTKYVIYDRESEHVNIIAKVDFRDEGVSGIKASKYAWSENKNIRPTVWTEFNSGDDISKNNCYEGKYYLWLDVSDNAGNKSDTEVVKYTVELEEAVAKIGQTYYYTIQSAVDAAGTSTETIEIIKDTDEVTTIFEGQNIILDLQGHSVGSMTSEQAVFTNNGTLRIIDTSTDKTAIIENFVGTGIENNGVLIIGDNNTNIEDGELTISGKKVGIQNNNILNYYDGTIKGKSAIVGNVQETPENYGPVGIYENGITIVNLRIISDYVARIDWFYYTTLQSAINDCKSKQNNTIRTTIHILKDIVLENTAQTYLGQNIILNLNGYTLTSMKGSVIINKGELEITDLTEEQKGMIISSNEGTKYTYYTLIKNIDKLIINGGHITTNKLYNYLINNSGSLEVKNGTINSDVNNSDDYVIYNNSNGEINVYGGIISNNNSRGNINYSSYVIYNKSNAKINIYGGKISCNSANGEAHCIYNYTDGKVNVYGGEIINSSSSKGYGIYNRGGTVNVESGTITNNSKYAYGIKNIYDGEVNIYGGVLNSENASYSSFGIDNAAGIVNVYGGEISSNSINSSSCGINNDSSKEVNIYGGKINTRADNTSNGRSYALSNNGKGRIKVNNGEINSSGNQSYGIYNANSGFIDVEGGMIKSSSKKVSYGIYNANTGTINVTAGKIISDDVNNSVGIYNKTNGIIIIGSKEDGIISTTNPEIIGGYIGTTTKGVGLYNKKLGIIYFYDGIIKGTSQAVKGSISDVEKNYQLKEEDIDGYNSIYLVEENKEIVVINEETNKGYTTLQKAIEDVKDNKVNNLKILKDFNVNSKVKILQNQNIVLDLAGNEVTSRFISINNLGNLTIKDTIGAGIFKFEYTVVGIENEGNLSIESGTISSVSNVDNYAVYNNGEGTINIYGGTISSNNNSSAYSELVSYGVYNNSIGTVNILGGTLSSSGVYSFGIVNNSIGTINILGGIISNTGTDVVGIVNESTGIINISDVTINNSATSESIAIDNKKNSGIINIYNVIINSIIEDDHSTNLSSGYGIYNKGGTVNIEEGRINIINEESWGSFESSAYGIYNSDSGTINIRGGTVNSQAGSISYGIYNDSSNGIINIGTRGDGIVNTSSPEIKGIVKYSEGYGLHNIKGKTYFYDGRIEGSTSAVDENTEITEIEENTEPLYENEDKILTLTTEAMDIAKIGDTTYSNLQEAINLAGTTQTTIELLRGIQFTNADTTVTIAEGQDIILDLKGFSIISAIEDAVITNNGNLKIIDSSENVTGKVSGSYDKTIYNKQGAVLELNTGTITKKLSKDNVVYNEGTISVTGAIISQQGDNGYSIYNTQTATLNIIDGQIIGGGNGIYNIGSINIINGTIEKGMKNTDSGSLNIENMTCMGQITNSENASINMEGGTIHVTNSNNYRYYAIKNTSTNIVTITGGEIIATGTDTSKAIYSTAGVINIGLKDGNISDAPLITGQGNSIEISSTSTLNLYDGILKGKICAIQGDITDIEEQSELVIGEQEEYETVSLISKDTALAEVNGNQYYSLKEAIDNISGTATVKILRKGIVENTINNLSGKDVVLDLNGNNLKMYTKIENTGTLTITDTSQSGEGNLYSYKDSPVYNSGDLTIEGGNISGNTYGIYNQTNGITEITGGNISDNTYGIYVTGGSVTVEEGNVANNEYGIFNNSGIVNIIGGNINNNEYGVYSSEGITNVTSGNITNNTYGIYNSSGTTNISTDTLEINGNTNEIYNGAAGTINILSGSVTTTSGVLIQNESNGTIVIGTQDGSMVKDTPVIQAEEYAIKNSGSGTIKFYDGTIKGKVGAIQGLYLYLETGYTTKTEYLNGYYCDTLTPSGTVTTVARVGTAEYSNLQSAINVCAEGEETIITLVNSISTDVAFVVEEGQNVIIDLNGKHIISSTAEYTIENAGSLTLIDSSDTQSGAVSNSYGATINNSGTLTLGENDETVSTQTPKISGITNAIVNTGTVNFYDGLLESTGSAISGTVTNRATGYIIISETVDGKQIMTLSK